MAPGTSRKCDYCGRETPEKQQMYSLRIEMFARAEPLIIGEDDLNKDHATEMDVLLKKMEMMDPEEAADQVHESYLFDLCASCRASMHRQLKERVADAQAEI